MAASERSCTATFDVAQESVDGVMFISQLLDLSWERGASQQPLVIGSVGRDAYGHVRVEQTSGGGRVIRR